MKASKIGQEAHPAALENYYVRLFASILLITIEKIIKVLFIKREGKHFLNECKDTSVDNYVRQEHGK